MKIKSLTLFIIHSMITDNIIAESVQQDTIFIRNAREFNENQHKDL